MPRSARKRLEWSTRAARDLLEIDLYISRDNPAAAEAVVDFIIRAGRAAHPTPDDGQDHETRWPQGTDPGSLSLYNIIYRIARAKVRIVRVIHQSRQFP